MTSVARMRTPQAKEEAKFDHIEPGLDGYGKQDRTKNDETRRPTDYSSSRSHKARRGGLKEVVYVPI